ncbi:MAG: YceD family protein [Bradyrhizobium sp.]
MNKATMSPADPWRASVTVAQIPESGLHRDLEANADVRKAIAEIAGLREIASAHASFDLNLRSGGRVHVAGKLRARIGQTCVVTLDPIENEIDQQIEVMFAPDEQIPPADLVADEDAVVESGPPEPIVGGVIDLGRLATDVLFLAIDPYPRKPGAVFERQVAAAHPEDHPFAALKALKSGPESAKPGNPRASKRGCQDRD